MRRYLLATTMLVWAGAASAQTCSVPGPAAAAGYTTQTFGAPLTVGTTPNPATSYPEIAGSVNVVPYTFTGTSWTNIGQTNSNGSVTLNGTGEAYGNGLATAEVTPAGQTLQGIAFGGGGYFQVTMSGNGPMSFWMNDAETMNGASNGTGADSADSWIEADIAEFDTTNAYAFSIHNWYGAIGSNQAINANENGASPAGANYTQPNTYGMLWVPATATTQGYARFYMNGVQYGNTVTWNQYIPGQTAADNPFAVMDSLHMVPILGSGQGSTTTFSNLQVWQASNANDIGTQVAADTAAAPCGSGAPTTTTPASPSSAPTPAPSDAPDPVAQPTAAITTQDPTPGEGSATDCSGNVWTVSSNNKIEENGVPVVGGGDTSQVLIQGCSIVGHSNGQNGSTTGWFTMGSTSPTTTDGWTVSAAPSGATAVTTAAAAPATASAVAATTTPAVAAPVVCGNGVASGAFHVAGGQIIGPDGKPFIARGFNIYDSQVGDGAAMVAMFPGVNFIRLGVGHSGYPGPDYFQAFITEMTSRGTVVEIEDHPDAGGGQDASPPQGIAAESAWYASLASAFKTNPYVWLGTYNEPAGTSELSSWQAATVNAIRGAGNNNIIMVYVGGELGVLQPSVYAGMTNIVFDDHYYGGGGSTDTDPILADSIDSFKSLTSADGVVPVIIGEYGNSQDGTNIDSNAVQAVTSVVNRGSSGQNGSAAWAWLPGGNADHLQDGGVLTSPYGQQVALYINTTVQTCTAAQTAANANQAITTAQATLQAQTAAATAASATTSSPDAAAPATATTASPTAAIEAQTQQQVDAIQAQTPAIDTAISATQAQTAALIDAKAAQGTP